MTEQEIYNGKKEIRTVIAELKSSIDNSEPYDLDIDTLCTILDENKLYDYAEKYLISANLEGFISALR